MRRLINVCGLPGSGKTTFAEYLAQETGGVAVAADDFFIGPDGQYRFDPLRLKDAHADCCRRVNEALAHDDATVIVHNTGTTERERDVYRAIADTHGAMYTELCVMSNRTDSTLAARNVHGVPVLKIAEMRRRFVVRL